MIWLLAALVAVAAFVVGLRVGRTTQPEQSATASPSVLRPTVDSAAIDQHPTGIVIADADGTTTFRNQAARQLAGTHVGVLIDDAVERHLAQGIAGESTSEQVELYGPPQKVVTVAATPMPDGGAVVFIDDITEAHRLDQVRTDFVANISHELKTPVGAISVLAETLVDESDPATIDRVVHRMVGEAQRASRTVDDLMELSRIELDAERLHEDVAISAILDAACDRVVELAAQRDITISRLAPVDGVDIAVDHVRGDRRQLVSALGNLVENAVKYSEDGGQVQVRVRANDPWLEFVCADHGVGIPSRSLDRIFERFYRVDRARSRATGGTGLGLSIVRHVANNHDGEVGVTSVEGEGSTFVLRLPLSTLSLPSQPDDVIDNSTEGIA